MAVHQQYIFKIGSIYIKTQTDIDEIKADLAKKLAWSKGFINFKSNIRGHLKKEQNGRCAFCRLRIDTGTSYPNLEHLVSKSDYPQFKFEPENLVYCCVRCNFSKIKANTLVNPIANKNLQIFPSNSIGFIIINPYLDDYHNHIDFLDDIIIIGTQNSSKGPETIRLYKLFRPELAEDRAYELQLNQKTVNQNLLNRLTQKNINQATIDQINNVIAQLPQWTI